MPRCLQCSEAHADALRRCPRCGGAPGSTTPGSPRVAVRAGGGRRPRNRKQMAILAVLLGIGALLAVAGVPASSSSGSAGASATRTVARPKNPSRKPEKELEVKHVRFGLRSASARSLSGEVLVEGRVDPRAVVAVRLDGRPLALDPGGDSFRAVVAPANGSHELVVEDLDGNTRIHPIVVTAPGEAERRRLVPRHEYDGHTFHVDSLDIEMRPGSASSRVTVTLDRVENFVVLPHRTLRIYRAPKGYVYFRRLDNGHLVFLREADHQQMVLVPGGLSRRGEGDAPPLGPRHVLSLRAYLIDRDEVTCAQYARFLASMGRAGDASFFHREDPRSGLRPRDWVTDRAPPGSENRPVTGVTWYAAYAYARWVGGHLPSEAQWERAAAGSPVLLRRAETTREWCDDRFDPRWYAESPRIDPRGPAGPRHRVVRGESSARHRGHADPVLRENHLGFRVARRWPANIR